MDHELLKCMFCIIYAQDIFISNIINGRVLWQKSQLPHSRLQWQAHLCNEGIGDYMTEFPPNFLTTSLSSLYKK